MHAFVQLDVFAADKTRRIFVHADDSSNPERSTLPTQLRGKTPDFCPFHGVSHFVQQSGAHRASQNFTMRKGLVWHGLVRVAMFPRDSACLRGRRHATRNAQIGKLIGPGGVQRPLDRRARADEAKVDKVDALQRGREFATH
jgi:hypothetical protein